MVTWAMTIRTMATTVDPLIEAIVEMERSCGALIAAWDAWPSP
jgi:hypothetical protein